MNQTCNLRKTNEQEVLLQNQSAAQEAKSPKWGTLTKIHLAALATAPPHSSNSAQALLNFRSIYKGEKKKSLLRKHLMTVKLHMPIPVPRTKEAQAAYMVLFLSLF